jgi:hypothetical protein
MLRPLLDTKLKPGIVVVAALVCVWTAYKHFAEEGERAGWFNLLLKVTGIALVAVVAYNAETIINGAVGAFIIVPRLVPLARQRVPWKALPPAAQRRPQGWWSRRMWQSIGRR